MQTTWVIAADSSRARIFEVGKENEKLREIEDMINPEGRQDGRDIQSDAEGQNFSGRDIQRSTSQPQQTMLEHDIELFCKEVSRYLDKACYEHRFDALCVIAPPKFLGMMRDNLGELARKAVTEEIPKDIAWFEGPEIEKYLRDKLH
jgi:protein required for attachment to host cells